MSDAHILTIILSCVVLVAIVFVVIVIAKVISQDNKIKLNKKNDIVTKNPTYEYFENTKVLSKDFSFVHEGLQLPKVINQFKVTFLLTDGQEKACFVEQEVFDSLKIGEVATLILVNGLFFDFGNGEDFIYE